MKSKRIRKKEQTKLLNSVGLQSIKLEKGEVLFVEVAKYLSEEESKHMTEVIHAMRDRIGPNIVFYLEGCIKTLTKARRMVGVTEPMIRTEEHQPSGYVQSRDLKHFGPVDKKYSDVETYRKGIQFINPLNVKDDIVICELSKRSGLFPDKPILINSIDYQKFPVQMEYCGDVVDYVEDMILITYEHKMVLERSKRG